MCLQSLEYHFTRIQIEIVELQISADTLEISFASLISSHNKLRFSGYVFVHVARSMYKQVFLCTEIFACTRRVIIAYFSPENVLLLF